MITMITIKKLKIIIKIKIIMIITKKLKKKKNKITPKVLLIKERSSKWNIPSICGNSKEYSLRTGGTLKKMKIKDN